MGRKAEVACRTVRSGRDFSISRFRDLADIGIQDRKPVELDLDARPLSGDALEIPGSR